MMKNLLLKYKNHAQLMKAQMMHKSYAQLGLCTST